MAQEDRKLVILFVVLSTTVLLTGTLAIYLTVTRSAAGDAAAEPADSTAPPRIAFISDLEGDVALYLMNTDGTGLERLSEPGIDWVFDPAWSPDGQRLACMHWSDESDQVSVWVYDVEGGDSLPIGSDGLDVFGNQPAWSPDGTMLAFAAPAEGEGGAAAAQVVIARADGSGVERTIALPELIQYVYDVNWSPRGDELVLLGSDTPARRSYTNAPFVYVVSVTGESLEQITRAWAADWAPDGEGGVVATYASPTLVQTVGWEQEPRAIAQLDGVFAVEADWSPDGGSVAILATRNQSDIVALYVIDVASMEVTTVADSDEAWLGDIDWSPDGRRLLFTQGPMRQRLGDNLPYADLWVYDLDQAELRQLTAQEGFEGMGVWSP